MRRAARRAAQRWRRGPAAAALALALAGCSVGRGEGEVKSDKLVARDCWDDAYDMGPNFFAAIPYRDTQDIRVQRGNDIKEVSDGLTVMLDGVEAIREGSLGAPLTVRLPEGVAPTGSLPEPCAEGAPCEGPRASFALYLHRSCHNQNVVLYGLEGTITFASLFNGNPIERQASEKLTEATFDVVVADPRDAPLGASPSDVPDELKSRITGYFRFYFERGQPGQPFP